MWGGGGGRGAGDFPRAEFFVFPTESQDIFFSQCESQDIFFDDTKASFFLKHILEI